MSIFSSFRKSRQHVKEHNAKLAEQKKQEDEATPYRHVPTHAALDAFASAPPSWREVADRPRIAEENRRRSAMAASGHHMNMPAPNFPRVGSSLSYVSYPRQATSPGPSRVSARIPRSYSYAGVSPYHDGGRDVIYSIPDVSQSQPDGFDFKNEILPVESNSGSSSSQEDLEMRASKTPAMTPQTASASHRLHPSTRSRRTSDASLDRQARNNAANHKAGPSTSSRDSRPPPSTRGYNYIPTSANPVPVQIGKAPRPLPVDAIAPDAQESQQFSVVSSHQNSALSLPGLTPLSSGLSSPAAPASPALGSSPTDLFLSSPIDSGRELQASYFTELGGRAPEAETEQVTPKTSRFTKMTSTPTNEQQPPQRARSVIVNYLPEPAAPVADDAASIKSKSKGKKLTKGKGKLVKKSRRTAVEASA